MLAAVILYYILISVFKGFSIERAMKYRTLFLKVILKWLGVRCKIFGNAILTEPTLIISNHRSYLDPAIALTRFQAKPVAKAEVSKWPLINRGLYLSGIIFVQRELQSSRKSARQAILKSIQEGVSVYICPEGTTHDQSATIEFRPATFYMAAEYQVPVLPIAIEYKDSNDAFIGDDTFLPHFIRTFGKRNTTVHFHIGSLMKDDNGVRLLNSCQSWIDDSLRKSQTIFKKSLESLESIE